MRAAANAKTALHIVHVNSVAGDDITEFLAHIQRARDAGQDVTTEAYPYGAGMTEIQSALFDDWRTWPDERFALNQLVSTGERLTRATFEKARKTGGTVITHGRSEEQTRAAIASPLAMIASDGFIENGRGHHVRRAVAHRGEVAVLARSGFGARLRRDLVDRHAAKGSACPAAAGSRSPVRPGPPGGGRRCRSRRNSRPLRRAARR